MQLQKRPEPLIAGPWFTADSRVSRVPEFITGQVLSLRSSDQTDRSPKLLLEATLQVLGLASPFRPVAAERFFVRPLL